MEIERAVENSDVVIMFLSDNSITKEGFVQKEIKKAIDKADEKPEGTVFIIPIRIEDCVVPKRLSKWQWIDYFPDERKRYAQRRLLNSLRSRAKTFDIETSKQISNRKAKEAAETPKIHPGDNESLSINNPVHNSATSNTETKINWESILAPRKEKTKLRRFPKARSELGEIDLHYYETSSSSKRSVIIPVAIERSPSQETKIKPESIVISLTDLQKEDKSKLESKNVVFTNAPLFMGENIDSPIKQVQKPVYLPAIRDPSTLLDGESNFPSTEKKASNNSNSWLPAAIFMAILAIVLVIYLLSSGAVK